MLRSLLAIGFVILLSSSARAEGWSGQAAAGGDAGLVPEFEVFGWALFQAVGTDKVGDGDLRFYYNTETVEVGIDRLSLADKLAFFIALRGEAIYAGVLRAFYQQGQRVDDLGFNASYIVLRPKLQWYFAPKHTLEVLTDLRYWWFGSDDTNPAYELPDDTFVFEPRIGYIYWNVTSPAEEWGADRLFPRIEGVAVGATVGLDIRSDHSAWGFAGDGRNDPDGAILTINQWLRAGWPIGDRVRLELQETANWGEGQDDVTRVRVGGMNPYVVVVPGLPWPAVLSSRLLVAQASAHFKVKRNKPQEIGLLVSGGTINDPFREGNLDRFGGIGGLALTTDLRWGIWQVYARLGWAFPTDWLVDEPYFSGLLGLGLNVFSN